jgi:hypothetical protein
MNEQNMSYIKVIVIENTNNTKFYNNNNNNNNNNILYQDKYDEVIMVGELVRNLCVNLSIDPDTVNGITKNVNVYIGNKLWNYNPYQSLKSLNNNIKDNQLILTIVLKEKDI